MILAGSSNGRMRVSGTRHLGSSPSPAANTRAESECFRLFAILLAGLGLEKVA